MCEEEGLHARKSECEGVTVMGGYDRWTGSSGAQSVLLLKGIGVLQRQTGYIGTK